MGNFVSASELKTQNEYIKKTAALVEGSGKCAFVFTLGCQQNEADSEKIVGMLTQMGYTMTDNEEIADVLIVNTCAIREHAEKRALSIVGRAVRFR
mgnify:FL=1